MNPLRAVTRWFSRAFGKPKSRAYYAGAGVSRLTDDWYALLISADRAIKADGRLLRSRSRQLHNDNAHIAGFIAQLKNDVIGYEQDGIALQARIKNLHGKMTPDTKKANKAIEDAFWYWGEPEVCSADGQNSWGDFQRLALGTWAIDGECLIRRLKGFDNEYGYALQMLDADQLDDRYNAVAESGRNEVRMGVEINKWGRPVTYHFLSRHPDDRPHIPNPRIAIPADEIIHLFVQLRPGQTRGLPLLTPVLIAMKMLDGYTEAEITQARIAASAGGFFTATGDDAAMYTVPEDNPSNGASDPSRYTMDFEPGLIRMAPPGTQYQGIDPTHPNGNFAAFQKAILRTVARGLGVSYNAFGNDLESVNYSSIRAGLLAERDTFRAMQRWITMRMHRVVYRDWLSMGSLYGKVKLPYPEIGKNAECAWKYRGWPWVDPYNDAQAFEIEWRNGLTNRTIKLGELGRDRTEVWEGLVEEQEEAVEMDIDVSGALGVQAQNKADEEKDEPDDEDDSKPEDDSEPDDDSEDNGRRRFSMVLDAKTSGQSWEFRPLGNGGKHG